MQAAAASGASKLDPRCSRRRSAGGAGGTTLFRSTRSDDDGGNERTSQRAERANRPRDVRAADLQEELAEQRFSVPPDPTKTAATSEHRSERSEQIDPRCSRRRSAGGAGGTTLFRPARSDEDGGNQRTSQRAERANRQSASSLRARLRASGIARRRTEEERAEVFFPLRTTTN